MEQNRVCSTEICLINMQDQLLSEGLHHRILQLILRAQRRYIAGKHSYGETQKANLEMPVASWRGSELHSSITTFVLLFKNEKKKSIVFPRHWLLPTHGFLWKWKYFPCFQGLSLTHSSLKSRLLGVMKEAMGGQSRQDRSRLLPFDLQFPVLFKILLARFLDFW